MEDAELEALLGEKEAERHKVIKAGRAAAKAHFDAHGRMGFPTMFTAILNEAFRRGDGKERIARSLKTTLGMIDVLEVVYTNAPDEDD